MDAGIFERDYLGSCFDEIVSTQMAQQSQVMMLNSFAFGVQQVKPEMLAKLTWSQGGGCVSEEKADPDYEAAIRELDDEFPGLRY